MKQHYLRLPIVAFFLMLSFQNVSAQNTAQTTTPPATFEVPTKPDVMPEYPGGFDAMIKFISQNLKYPEKAKASKLEGLVYVSFTVDSLGKITNTSVKKTKYTIRKLNEKTSKEDIVAIENPKDKSLEAEAMRVIKAMPRWKPGMSLGQPINATYTLPIKFDLNKMK